MGMSVLGLLPLSGSKAVNALHVGKSRKPKISKAGESSFPNVLLALGNLVPVTCHEQAGGSLPPSVRNMGSALCTRKSTKIRQM